MVALNLKISSLPWSITATGLPLLVAVFVMQLVGPRSAPSIDRLSFDNSDSIIPALINYSASVTTLLGICVALLVFFVRFILNSPASTRHSHYAIAIPYLILLLLTVLCMPLLWNTGALTLVFFQDLFEAAEATFSNQVYLAYALPTILAATTGVIGSVAASVTTQALPKTNNTEWELKWSALQSQMRRIVFLMTLLFVVSTLTASLFFHIPVNLVDSEFRAFMLDYANAVSIFWGSVFTLTFFASISPHLMFWHHQARRLVDAMPSVEDQERVSNFLSSRGLFPSLRQQITLAFSILSPMMTGFLASMRMVLSQP